MKLPFAKGNMFDDRPQTVFGAEPKTHAQSGQLTGEVRSYSGPNGHIMVIVPGGKFMLDRP